MYYYQKIIVALDLVLPILAIITVFLRFQARKAQKQSIKADDWVILLALVFTLADAILTIDAVYNQNYGNLLVDYTPQQIVYSFTSRRIFVSSYFVKIANVYLGVCATWTLAGVLSAIFRSNPISAYWEKMGETRYNFGAWNITMAVLDIVLDLGILALPIPVIRSLQISTRKKVSVMAVFLLGVFCVVSSAVRLYYARYLNEVDSSPLFIMKYPVDATYITNSAALWSHIECSASIITANLPTLVPVARKFQIVSQSMKGWFSSSILGSSSSRGTGYDRQTSEPRLNGSVGLSDVDSHHSRDGHGMIKVNTTYTVSEV